MHDLVIRNGTIVDGTGAAGRRGDVAIADGRIVDVGAVSGDARREVDASGLVVAPGFIDVHAHDDAAVVREPAMDFKVMQGVTTDVVGNCGAGVAPASDEFRRYYRAGFGPILGDSELPWTTTAQYFAAVDAARPACNVAAYVPHGVLRYHALGMDRREPDDAELAHMRELAEEAMEAGAIGLSSGLIYPPGTFARTPELIEVAKVAGTHGGIYTSHIRNEGEALLDAVAEAIEIGERAGCPVQISHHKAGSPPMFGKTVESLGLIDEARARGVDVTVDVYPYTASSSSLAAMARFGPELFNGIEAIIASVRHNKAAYEGKYVREIAAALGISRADAVRKVLADEENTPTVIMFIMDEGDVRRVLSWEHAMIGSDGIPSEGKPHPRLYGTFPRVLGTYVRDEGVLTLEDAVRKMTSLPAKKHRIGERGELREGWHADVVVFDASKVADVATYQDPRQHPPGIEYVVVNGEVAVDRGKQTDARAGRMVRRAAVAV
jgi:N-acyl-D-amino-acid deacylase